MQERQGTQERECTERVRSLHGEESEQESKSMKKSECMCARVCEKDHARKREIESKKENEWNGTRKRWHEEENEREGVGKCKCMVAGKAQGHKKECKVVKKKAKVQQRDQA